MTPGLMNFRGPMGFRGPIEMTLRNQCGRPKTFFFSLGGITSKSPVKTVAFFLEDLFSFLFFFF